MTERKSFLRQFFNNWGLWALLAGAVLAFAFSVARIDAAKARQLADEGADAMATVTALTQRSTRSNNQTTQHFDVHFSFTAAGVVHVGEHSVSASFYHSLRKGDLIPIRYWMLDPSLTEVVPGFYASQARIGQIVGSIAGLVALIFTGLGLRWASQARWMVRNGVERRVTITRLDKNGLTFGKKSLYRAVWPEADGREGRSRQHRSLRLPGVGTETTIMADPTGSRPSLWQGDL